MAEIHSSNLISRVQLPGANGSTVVYDIHDVEAVHTLADLAALGMDTSGIFVYKGTVATVDNLPKTGAKVGEVYHVTSTKSEYVWAEGRWEEFGEHFLVNHTHNVTVTGSNSTSKVTGSATVTVPKVTETAKYTKITSEDKSFIISYDGATSNLVTAKITPAGTATSVISSITPTSGSITGVSGSIKASRAAVTDALNGATVGNSVAVGVKLTDGQVKAGEASTWSAIVEDGVLSFSFSPNTPTEVVLPNLETAEITPAAPLNIPQYSFSDVDVPVAANVETTVVTSINSSSVNNVATIGEEVTVATGELNKDGTGSSVMTGLGTPSTAKALISASLAAASSSTDGVHTGDEISIATESVTGTIDGTAAAQAWNQTSAVTGDPIS